MYGINYAPEPIGVGRYTGELGAYLVSQNIRVDVVTAVPHYPGWVLRSGYSNRYRVEYICGARVTRCPMFLTSEMRGLWRLFAPLSFAITSAPIAVWRIFSIRPDAVFCVEPTLFCAPVALLAAKLVGARTVLHVQDLEIDAAFSVGHLKSGFARNVAILIERVVLRCFDSIVTVSKRMLEKLTEKEIPRDRLSVVRNWVDLEKIIPQSGRSKYRDELELSDEIFVALYSGNVGPKQALPLVLEAASQLEQRKDLLFVIAGEGPEKSQLVARYGHLSNVRFLPLQPEERLCEFLNFANVHVLPQHAGAADLVLPSKLGGMLASGKPCIVMSDAGSELHDFLSTQVILTPSGDIRALAKSLVALMDSNVIHDPKSQRQLAGELAVGNSLSALQNILFESAAQPQTGRTGDDP